MLGNEIWDPYSSSPRDGKCASPISIINPIKACNSSTVNGSHNRNAGEPIH